MDLTLSLFTVCTLIFLLKFLGEILLKSIWYGRGVFGECRVMESDLVLEFALYFTTCVTRQVRLPF